MIDSWGETVGAGTNLSMMQPVRSTSGRWAGSSGHRRESGLRQYLGKVDLVLVFSAVAMAAIGALMVYSATRYKLASQGVNPKYYLERDIIFLAIGTLVMLVLTFLDYHTFESLWIVLYGGTVFMLLVVLLPGLGTKSLGSQRWFQLGPFQLQPSAFSSIAVIASVAAVCATFTEEMTFRNVLTVVGMVLIPMALVIKQPDLGTGIIISVILVGMLVVAGAKKRHLLLLLVCAALAVVVVLKLGLLHHYQLDRLVSFIHQSKSTLATGYNQSQAKIDIGSGGLTGKGLFRDPTVNLAYVPEQQTDFIFTAVGGQLGFVGAASVLALYGVILSRVWRAARVAEDRIGTLICAGVFSLLCFSIFENAGMAMGIMPVTGIPLPFLSYGGSADIAFFAAIGLALNVGIRRSGRAD